MAISLSAWIICEEPVLPCVDNTECQLFTPSLEIIKSNYLLVAVMKSPLQETVFMEDYLKDMQPLYPSRHSGFYPWIKPDDQRAVYLDQMVWLLVEADLLTCV